MFIPLSANLMKKSAPHCQKKGVVREFIAESCLEIDQARLLTLHAARKMDAEGANARTLRIVDGPDQVHLRDIGRLELKNYQ